MLIAAALAGEGLADSARATLSRAVKQNPMPEATQDWEAAVRLKLGQRDDASRLIKSYLGTRPHDRPRIENSRLFRGIPQNRSTATG